MFNAKNNTPRCLLIEFGAAEKQQLADNEDLPEVSKRLIEKNKQAYGLQSLTKCILTKDGSLVFKFNVGLEITA